MILPTKHLSTERSLIGIGADLIQLLSEPKTISRLWDEWKYKKSESYRSLPINYDWFILTLDFLYIIQAIDYERGKIRRRNK